MPSPITPAELLKLGDFAAGSMGPKVGAPAMHAMPVRTTRLDHRVNVIMQQLLLRHKRG